jgi:mRNA interferase YafQ
MRSLRQDTQFRRDYKLQKKRSKKIEKLEKVVQILLRYGRLPALYQSHRLSGEWMGLWECHIESDWLLIYDVNDAGVLLMRTGTHSDLFE